jgi:kumamolisin
MALPRIELHGEVPRPLRGSAPREALPDPQERIAVTVVLRSRADLAGAVEALARQRPRERRLPSPEEFEERFGSSREDLEKVQAFAAEHGLEVIEASAARGVVELAGTLGQLARAFGVRFLSFQSPRRAYRSHDGPILIPSELKEIVENVIGLDDRPILSPATAAAGGTAEGVTQLVFNDPRKLAAYYSFPTGGGTTGTGQSVALIQFGGGYNPGDMEDYFQLRGIPCPEMALIELDGQTNQPASAEVMQSCAAFLGLLGPGYAGPNDAAVYQENSAAFWATLECTMDPQILGTVVPGARLVTYMAPDTPKGRYDAFSKAISDGSLVINCSWGSAEDDTPQSSMISLDQLFQKAALKGVTICASAGDFGNGQPSHFPATSPHVLACGGTSVDAGLTRETSWYEVISNGTLSVTMAGGGGYSQFFQVPSWQTAAGQTGRGYPDVAAKSDVMNGYDVLVTGLDLPMGGTSAAAPMWAGLVTAINATLGQPTGYLTPLLYSADFAKALEAITQSGGGTCQPTPGWNPCTGLGSPIGTGLLAALSAEPPAARSE